MSGQQATGMKDEGGRMKAERGGQHFRIEAEFSFDTATALIRELIADGFTLSAKQTGNVWTITGDLSERDEFGEILAGLKARGVITEADVERLERDGLKEVAHA